MSKLKIYLAGGWKFRDKIRKQMNQLKQDPRFEVCSTWIDRENGNNTPLSQAEDAYYDIKEVCQSDVLVAIMDDPDYAYRGTFTEIGCALGLQKPIILLCPGKAYNQGEFRATYSHKCMTNVFYHHKNIKHVVTWDNVLEALSELSYIKK